MEGWLNGEGFPLGLYFHCMYCFAFFQKMYSFDIFGLEISKLEHFFQHMSSIPPRTNFNPQFQCQKSVLSSAKRVKLMIVYRPLWIVHMKCFIICISPPYITETTTNHEIYNLYYLEFSSEMVSVIPLNVIVLILTSLNWWLYTGHYGLYTWNESYLMKVFIFL